MTPSDFRRIALSFEGAEEGSHMGAADFRVGGRIFATLASVKPGLRQPDDDSGTSGSLHRRAARPFSSRPWRLGQNGHRRTSGSPKQMRTRSPARSTPLEAARREEPQGGKKRSASSKPVQNAGQARSASAVNPESSSLI
jgi:hypothetical protein